MNLQGRPPKLNQLLLRYAAALADVLIVVKALLTLVAPCG